MPDKEPIVAVAGEEMVHRPPAVPLVSVPDAPAHRCVLPPITVGEVVTAIGADEVQPVGNV